MAQERMIFVNLPVTDLNRSIAFYEAVGGTKEPKFSNDAAAMIRFTDAINVMLLTHDFYKTFTTKPIADTHATSAALLCLSADSTGAVDAMVEQAAGAGGKADPGPKQDMGGMMYGRSFEDPDGHHWEVMWMDAAAAEAGAGALEGQPA
ncbi:VOC family protein [Sphingomonas rhizophila]|uniref:VOC family protein n=1 Tax=Sphingomonas rhizophila TaxID=2071607 RepID=A0A7G9SA24_9SPHN|nr:VOC family protein [Sphingomonas rhizophila]QNN64699.1 VOC family protein [Sphingomonas rhizophila]